MECVSGGSCYEGKYCQCVACEKYKNIELLPCPFCGGKATVERSAECYEEYEVCCDECGAKAAWDNDKDSAVKLWNTRIRNDGSE